MKGTCAVVAAALCAAVLLCGVGVLSQAPPAVELVQNNVSVAVPGQSATKPTSVTTLVYRAAIRDAAATSLTATSESPNCYIVTQDDELVAGRLVDVNNGNDAADQACCRYAGSITSSNTCHEDGSSQCPSLSSDDFAKLDSNKCVLYSSATCYTATASAKATMPFVEGRLAIFPNQQLTSASSSRTVLMVISNRTGDYAATGFVVASAFNGRVFACANRGTLSQVSGQLVCSFPSCKNILGPAESSRLLLYDQPSRACYSNCLDFS